MEYSKIVLSGAKCAVDLGDGSERGEYVCQDYILNTLGRPHRMVNLMYTYYPKDEQWPSRVSEACKDMEVHFAWDYPYDDYFPYNDEGKQFEQMRDIRMHGQDVMLTLTVDCSLEDSYLRKLAQSLRPYGRLCIRINHECNGDWFTHNKRFTYEEVAEFFVRFAKIIKEEAPQVKTIFCAGLITPANENGEEKIDKEDIMLKAYKEADIWSADRYLALHYGWPYDIAEADDKEPRYYADNVSNVYDIYKRSYERLSKLVGDKPFIQAEFNTDGDVTGPLEQADSVVRYYKMIRDNKAEWMTGISMYQFRDRGRLGLEIEDPNNSSVGIKQPILDDYKKLIQDDYFSPQTEAKEKVAFPADLRWGGSEDAEGISVIYPFEKTPQFCEVTCQKDLALMISVNGRWFYKAPGVETIDLMPAFFEKPLDGASDLAINFFATPVDGTNPDNGREDWAYNYYTKMTKEPEFRVRYTVPGIVG